MGNGRKKNYVEGGENLRERPMPEQGKISLSSAPWTMHEFFAGSGLVAYGLKGLFAPIWANDISEQKATVYRANFDSDHFHLGDIKDVRGETLPYAHLSWASFPCQDLSLAGSIGGINAHRSGLVWEWLRVLDEMSVKPRMLLIENVTGLISVRKGENYQKLHIALSERGYRCGAIVLDAAQFLPQSRPRVFVIAVAKGFPIPDELVDDGPNWLHSKAAAEIGKTLPDWIWWKSARPPRLHPHIEDIIETEAPFDKDDVLGLIPEKHLAKLRQHETTYATGYRRTRHGEQQLEVRCDGIAGCLRTPEGGSSRQYLVVKRNDGMHARLLTVREVARLMGAPDDFVLPGSYNDGYKAMGDAVALPVARFVGEAFLVKIAEAAYDDQRAREA